MSPELMEVRLVRCWDEPGDEQVLDAQHEASDEAVPPVGEHEAVVTPPVARRPTLSIAQLKLSTVRALYFRRR
jgi:hypothetical protein